MTRWPIALLLVAACADDHAPCPDETYLDAFELVLSSETWNAAQYTIEVSYMDPGDGGAADFSCEVPIPALPDLDGGVLAPDASVDGRGNFACNALTRTSLIAGGTAGQQLVLDFQGTPSSAHLVVSDSDRLVLERDVPLSYERQRPNGESCPGPLRAWARVELPQ